MACRWFMLSLLVAALADSANAGQVCSVEPAKLRYEDRHECGSNSSARQGFAGTLKYTPLSDDGEASLHLGWGSTPALRVHAEPVIWR